MPNHRVAWLPGDGTGPEVCAAARLTLDAAGFEADYVEGDVGWEFWKNEGNPLPERTVKLLRSTDCAFFGAITSKPVTEAERELIPEFQGRRLTYRSPIVSMRQLLDLYICLRPCKAFQGNPLNYRDSIDIVIVRENTEGFYVGVEFSRVPERFFEEAAMARIPPNAAISIGSVTRERCRRIAKAAFEHAVNHGRRKVTAVHKANVLRTTGGLFLEATREVAPSYPQILFEEADIDAVCAGFLKRPQEFDVILTTNLFGDLLSVLGAQLVGGMGFGYSGNIGLKYAVFEPTHGSAPKYTGKNKVNPIAAILAAKMMLEWLGERERAAAIEQAVAKVIRQGRVRTYDMGGNATTTEMAQAIAAAL